MVGLLVRIACAMNFHREMAHESIYLRELRRRLWYSVIFLDSHASFDRGSEPVIRPDAFDRQLPCNVNDTDFDETSTSLTPRDGEVTDMSFSLVIQEAAYMLTYINHSEGQSSGATWQKRLEVANNYSKNLTENTLRCLDPNIPVQRLLISIGKVSAQSLVLSAVRPMQHRLMTAPPPVSAPWVLQMAVDALRECDASWNDNLSQTWRRLPWVPWHAIAVALAGCCTIRGTELSEEAWTLANLAMERYGGWVADTKSGMLWTPVVKLHKRVSALREADAAQKLSDSSKNPNLPVESVPTPSQGFASGDFNPNVTAPVDFSTNLYGIDALDVPPDLLSSVTNDNWLDWESIIQDMDQFKDTSMQFT